MFVCAFDRPNLMEKEIHFFSLRCKENSLLQFRFSLRTRTREKLSKIDGRAFRHGSQELKFVGVRVIVCVSLCVYKSIE